LGIVKNPISYTPSLNETLKSLEKRLENALDSMTEEQLLGCWTACSERLLRANAVLPAYETLTICLFFYSKKVLYLL
jgi:hypothetical protein